MKKIVLFIAIWCMVLCGTPAQADRIEYQVELQQGWNLMALPFIMEETESASWVLQNAISVRVMWRWDGNVWSVWRPGATNNTLLSIKPGVYWIYMLKEGVVKISKEWPDKTTTREP